MVLNAAVQMLREADELKQKISKFKSGISMLQEHSLWATQQQLQKVYQKVLVLDLDYALDKKVEQDLWNVGFKQQIEALQAISKDRKSPHRSEGQAMLSWVLQAAAGFYLCLLHQICTAFKLDLPFRRRASLLGLVEGWGASEPAVGGRLPPPAAARYICQHCLVHLGDLARYRQQLRVAHTFYRHALVVSAHSGQPYNQLALVAWRRGQRLGALYWHVRSLLVRAPFPPAPANLARTLRAAAVHTNEVKDLPVIPGVAATSPAPPAAVPTRFDAHSYVTELIKAIHYIHTVEELDTASALVSSLNSSLTALIATESFESMTLIKMACVLIWLVHSSTEELSVEMNALTEAEARAAQLSCSLSTGALLALLLPNYTVAAPLQSTLPALKVLLQWVVWHPRVVSSRAWGALAALWPALAHTANMLAPAAHLTDTYDSVPLPEDEELTGFLPLENALKGLKFPNHATWDTYGGRVPDLDELGEDNENESPAEVSPTCLSAEPGLEQRVRAHRLLQLMRRLAEIAPEYLTCTTSEDGKLSFTASSMGGEQLSEALATLSATAGSGAEKGNAAEPEDESDEEPTQPTPLPLVVISEADFREKVRDKRFGILKPQGSLERAREERAMATQDEQEPETNEDKKESRKPRINIAMAAIMRKQEETNKQVKFVTPPQTPDSTADTNEDKDDKPKTIQPKPIKSLANLPFGRKTGGILSLKDKSAGYPHLVNTEEPPKKAQKEEKKEKPNQGSSQNSQNYQQKRPEQPSPNWSTNTQNQYTENQRMSLQKNYGLQNTGLSYNPNYQTPNVNNQGIKLPVVNPKEIDVRTAALQKQNSRQELFHDGAKFNQGYQISGDKKNFLNDLPPRFANQYRYWQNAQENQFENKFRDDSFKANTNTLFNNQSRTWNTTPQLAPQSPDSYQQQQVWWKADQPPNFTANFNAIQPNFYSPHIAPPNPYQNMNYSLQTNIGQVKQESFNQQNYLQNTVGQSQLPTLQNLATTPNFNASLNSFNTYAPSVGYDSSMYPQFSNKMGYQSMQMKMLNKPQLNYQGNKELVDLDGLGFGSNVLQQRNLNMNFNEMVGGNASMKNGIKIGGGEGPSAEAGSTYSLFSGADAAAWGAPKRQPSQSLWSDSGLSPLELLLEQQKNMQPPTTQ